MGAIRITQQLALSIGKVPSVSGGPVTEKYFDISPAQTTTVEDYSECVGERFMIAAGVTDQALGMGTVALGHCLVIIPDADLTVKVVNANGTSQNVVFKGARPSVVHMDFTGLLASNSGSTSISGRYAVVGD